MKLSYEIEGDKKWLIRDGKRFVSTEATACEMELWAALQAKVQDQIEQDDMDNRFAIPAPTGDAIERAKEFYRRVRNLAVGDELWRCPTNMSRQEVAEFAAWFAQEEAKDSAADDRDFNMIADELGAPRTREDILKAIRALKKK